MKKFLIFGLLPVMVLAAVDGQSPEELADPCSPRQRAIAPVQLPVRNSGSNELSESKGDTTFFSGDLDVKGVGIFDFIRTRDSVGIGNHFLAITGPVFGIRVGGNTMNQAVASPNRFVITSGGKIGIGTDSPVVDLDVKGVVRSGRMISSASMFDRLVVRKQLCIATDNEPSSQVICFKRICPSARVGEYVLSVNDSC